ncbi:MAG: hypothetical protein HY080_10705 [Gammaproteobacteria bacterium]|nr:hypothetical protein [Gammaproteobacteria bacterium]
MTVVDACAGMDETLSAHNKLLLEHMLLGGDSATWQQAREIVISPLPLITLGMAVNHVTPIALRLEVPDPFTIYRALRFTLRRRG